MDDASSLSYMRRGIFHHCNPLIAANIPCTGRILAQNLKYKIPYEISSGNADFPSILSDEIEARDRWADIKQRPLVLGPCGALLDFPRTPPDAQTHPRGTHHSLSSQRALRASP